MLLVLPRFLDRLEIFFHLGLEAGEFVRGMVRRMTELVAEWRAGETEEGGYRYVSE